MIRLTAGLQEYAETVQDRNEDSAALLVQDPRSDAEKEQARMLQELKASAVPNAPSQSRKIAGKFLNSIDYQNVTEGEYHGKHHDIHITAGRKTTSCLFVMVV